MRVMQPPRGAERVQRRTALDRLRGHHAGSRDKRRAIVQVIRDGVVSGAESGIDDALAGDGLAERGVTQLLHQVDVLRRVNELELLDRRGARRHEVALLDEPCRGDELHRQLDADRLQWMLIGQVVLHQLIAVNERHRS